MNRLFKRVWELSSKNIRINRCKHKKVKNKIYKLSLDKKIIEKYRITEKLYIMKYLL